MHLQRKQHVPLPKTAKCKQPSLSYCQQKWFCGDLLLLLLGALPASSTPHGSEGSTIHITAHNCTEQHRTAQHRTEQNKQNRTEQNRTEQNRTEEATENESVRVVLTLVYDALLLSKGAL
jgi:hypothetical protein